MTAVDQYAPPPGAETLASYCLHVIGQRGAGEGFALGSRALAARAEAFFSRPVNERDVRAAVHELRLAGEPICSSNSGFFWPASLQDIYQTVEIQFRSLARIELLIARKLRDSGRRLFGGQWRLL